jgi:hypothetical protein
MASGRVSATLAEVIAVISGADPNVGARRAVSTCWQPGAWVRIGGGSLGRQSRQELGGQAKPERDNQEQPEAGEHLQRPGWIVFIRIAPVENPFLRMVLSPRAQSVLQQVGHKRVSTSSHGENLDREA